MTHQAYTRTAVPALPYPQPLPATSPVQSTVQGCTISTQISMVRLPSTPPVRSSLGPLVRGRWGCAPGHPPPPPQPQLCGTVHTTHTRIRLIGQTLTCDTPDQAYGEGHPLPPPPRPRVTHTSPLHSQCSIGSRGRCGGVRQGLGLYEDETLPHGAWEGPGTGTRGRRGAPLHTWSA